MAIFSFVEAIGLIIMEYITFTLTIKIDAIMLLFAITGLCLTIFEQAQNIVGAIITFVLSGLSLALTLGIDDPFDVLGMPLCCVEEIISTICFLYAETNVLDYLG